MCLCLFSFLENQLINNSTIRYQHRKDVTSGVVPTCTVYSCNKVYFIAEAGKGQQQVRSQKRQPSTKEQNKLAVSKKAGRGQKTGQAENWQKGWNTINSIAQQSGKA